MFLGCPSALSEGHDAALGDGILVDGPVAVAWGEDQVEEDYNDRLHRLSVLALRHAAVLQIRIALSWRLFVHSLHGDGPTPAL